MKLRLLGATCCLLSAAGTAAGAPTPNYASNPADASLETTLDANIITVMQALNIPGMATVVVKDGTVRWMQTYGVRDKSQSETLSTNKIAITTPFRAASVSKAVSAVVALRMVESSTGYLFSEYVDDYLPTDFPLVNPAYPSARVTLAQLLTHTSSISDIRPPNFPPASISDSELSTLVAAASSNTLTYTNSLIADWIGTPSTATTVGNGEVAYYVAASPPSDGTLTLEQYLRRLLVPGGADYPTPSFSPNRTYLPYTPGTVYTYNNVNTTLLGYVLERASALQSINKTFAELAEDFVFSPLGMSSGSFALSSTTSGELAATALPHDSNDSGSQVRSQKLITNYICSKVSGCVPPYTSGETTTTDYQPIPLYGEPQRPAKALRVSIEDLGKFVSMLAERGDVGGTQFLAQSTVDAMTTDQLASGIHPDGTGTGYGLFRLVLGTPVVTNDSVWGHEGGDSGVSACMLFSKVTGYGAAVLINSPSAGQVCPIAQELYRELYDWEN